MSEIEDLLRKASEEHQRVVSDLQKQLADVQEELDKLLKTQPSVVNDDLIKSLQMQIASLHFQATQYRENDLARLRGEIRQLRIDIAEAHKTELSRVEAGHRREMELFEEVKNLQREKALAEASLSNEKDDKKRIEEERDEYHTRANRFLWWFLGGMLSVCVIASLIAFLFWLLFCSGCICEDNVEPNPPAPVIIEQPDPEPKKIGEVSSSDDGEMKVTFGIMYNEPTVIRDNRESTVDFGYIGR